VPLCCVRENTHAGDTQKQKNIPKLARNATRFLSTFRRILLEMRKRDGTEKEGERALARRWMYHYTHAPVIITFSCLCF
jgi:hypothetical protein